MIVFIIIILILMLAFLIINYALLVGMSNGRTPEEHYLDDREQEEQLMEWVRKHRRKDKVK